MIIPFIKAHGARNDFLLTWRDQLPSGLTDSATAAVAICDRHTGVGADGWLLMSRQVEGADAAIELYNSDGSRSEMSGNGTRCAAALLCSEGLTNKDSEIRILTGAGVKSLKLLTRADRIFSFEMNMGAPKIEELHANASWQGDAQEEHTVEDRARDAVILNVGNPQCVFFVDDFDFPWQALGARVERHKRFPNRTNVSFVKIVDRQTVDVRFFERGAGETMSSGTGSTGAAAAAVSRGLVVPPVRVLTPAGVLDLRWSGDDIFLAGPAELVASGEFYWTT
jgi:diaminopimelate epimerase